VNIVNVALNTPEGVTVTLGDYLEGPTVVVLVRYSG
jgi:hypothetical protein